jgi:hypothetical protein
VPAGVKTKSPSITNGKSAKHVLNPLKKAEKHRQKILRANDCEHAINHQHSELFTQLLLLIETKEALVAIK